MKNQEAKTYQHTSQALEDVQIERARQIHQEGWTPSHDDETHDNGDLARAGACYAMNAGRRTREAPEQWPWAARFWKPKNRRRDLVRAAALIIAEIEMLDRLESYERGEIDG